jgi:fibronectin-binding autotransporter adhesin
MVIKAATGTNLALGASWEGGVAPTAGDTAEWYAAAPISLGPGLTGNLSIYAIYQEGASSNIAHSAGTITFSDGGGFTQVSTNTRVWTESGTWAIGSGTVSFTIARSTPNTTVLDTSAASGLTGDSASVISVFNGSDFADPMYAIWTVRGANTGFLGQIYLNPTSNLHVTGTGVLANASVVTDAFGEPWITAGQASASLGTLGTTTLEVGADLKLGWSTRTLTLNSATSFTGSVHNVTLADNVTFAGPLGGTPDFVNFASVGATWLALTLDNTANTISGSLDIGNYVITYLNCASGFNLPNVSEFTITGNLRLAGSGGSGFVAPHTFTGVSFYGDGAVEVVFSATNLVSFPAGSLSGLTGINEPALGYATAVLARSGLVLWTSPYTVASRQSYVDVKDLPSRVTFQCTASVNATSTGRLYYTGPGTSYPNTRIDMVLRDNTYPAVNVNEIYANNASGIVEIGEGVKRHGDSATQTLTLRGTGAGRISGTINPNARGALNLSKTDPGTWYLSANNTSTGTTTVSQGILQPELSTCLGTTGAVTVNNTGTMVLGNGFTLSKGSAAFTFAKTDGTAAITLPTNAQATLATAGITLGAVLRLGLGAGSKLTIANTGAITDGASSFGIHADCSSLVSRAELVLEPASNTFDGTITVEAATLTVYTLNNIGVAGIFGTGSTPLSFTHGTLKFSGNAPNSTNRGITSYTSGCTLEAAGTAAATFSGPMTKVEGTGSSYTLTITGTSTAANTLASTLANATGITTALTKSGTGYWRATGALSYTGATTVSTGTLRVERPDGNTMASTVTVASTATVELATDTLPSSGATAGRVLGTGSVIVNGGTIKTRGGSSVQKGQARYGGNLTFGAGSRLEIGTAA